MSPCQLVRLPIVGDGGMDAEGRVAELRVIGGERPTETTACREGAK